MTMTMRAEKLFKPIRKLTQIVDSINRIENCRSLVPNVQGISDVRLRGAVKRMRNVADALKCLGDAALSPDEELRDYVVALTQNPRFLACLQAELSKAQASVETAAPAANTDPTSEANPDPAAESELPSMAREGGGAKPEENFDPQDTTTKMNGADSRLRPGSYTADQMLSDLAAQKGTVEHLRRTKPFMALDSIQASVSRVSAVPEWSSPVWSDAARAAYRHHALFDGEAAAHLARYGVDPCDYKGNTRPVPLSLMPDGPIRRYFESE